MSTRYYVIYDNPLRAWVSTAASVAAIVCLIGLGVYLESAAMQWFGFVLSFLTILTIFKRLAGEPMTIDQAIADLERKKKGE